MVNILKRVITFIFYFFNQKGTFLGFLKQIDLGDTDQQKTQIFFLNDWMVF